MTAAYGAVGYGLSATLTLKALAAAIVGGIGSVPGAFVGGQRLHGGAGIASAAADHADPDDVAPGRVNGGARGEAGKSGSGRRGGLQELPARDAAGSQLYLHAVPFETSYAWVTPVVAKADESSVLATVLDPRFDVRTAAVC